MLTTLFHIPSRLGSGPGAVPIFGYGLLLAVWAVAGAVVLAREIRRQGWCQAVVNPGVPLAIMGGVVAWMLPMLDDGAGVPVRGYGAMLLVAAVAGTWLSIRRGRVAGFEADTILSLGTHVFLWGLVGARLFYVIEYHRQFFPPGASPFAGLAAALNIAAGGLVVFGALPTAGLAAWWYSRRHGLPLLRLADVIAPGLLLGLAIGRLGCFLNGCCYGGPTDLPWGVSFPPDSPPAVAFPAPTGRSVPVHPAQVYAAVDAVLLAAVAICFTPLTRRPGAVFALVLTLHPLSRILLEAIRVDEPPALGTPLSISQLISLVLLALAGVLWWWVLRTPVERLQSDGSTTSTA